MKKIIPHKKYVYILLILLTLSSIGIVIYNMKSNDTKIIMGGEKLIIIC